MTRKYSKSSTETPKFAASIAKRRWVVERSIGWITTHRCLARDYETHNASSEAVIHITTIDNLTKRITGETTPTWRGIY
ncbi:transposase [Streptomyces sp. NPDC056821]|uniref:transposase n=1 Tax=unclassified Streptomyces TaxID=2593676 RepID=UPI0036C915B3